MFSEKVEKFKKNHPSLMSVVVGVQVPKKWDLFLIFRKALTLTGARPYHPKSVQDCDASQNTPYAMK